MNLPFFKKQPSIVKREYLFALEISHSLVKSAVWSVINGKPQVLSQAAPVSWDDQTDQSLLTACDTCLTQASVKLDATGKTDITRVILGLPSDWLAGEKINPSWLKLLKTILQKLSLKAVGFVVTPDAAVRYLQSQDNVPPTAILIGLSPAYLEITLVRLGKVDGIQLVKRSTQLVSDVVEGLSRFPQVNLLPSRILLYDSGSDLEAVKQLLLAHPWQSASQHLPFLHFPKIDSLPADFTIRAIALAGGSEVAQALGIISPPEVTAVPPAEPSVSPRDLGFAADGDISEISNPAPEIVSVPSHQAVVIPEITEDQLPAKIPTSPRFTLPRLSFLPLLIFIVIAAVGLLFAAYWFLPTAKVTLTVSPKPLQHQFDVTADTQAGSVDINSAVLPARYVEVAVSGDKSVSTTGSKIIGDKATGSVTIINGTAVTKTFSSGTAITSPSGLKFTFDTSVDVASASGTADPSSYQPGKATVKVTASQIGTDSNLSAGTSFKIGSYSSLDYIAKNDSAFSGGSSRQAQVVSKDDLNNLRVDLSSQLKNDAQTQLSSQIAATDTLAPQTIQVATINEEFNHKVDDIADNLSLKLSVKAKGLVFAKSDLNSLVDNQLRPLIPADYSITGVAQTSFAVKNTTAKQVQLTVDTTASLMPEYNQSRIVSALVGKTPQKAREYLTSLPGVAYVEIAIRPQLPTSLLNLPHSAKNINFTVVTPQ